MDSLIRRPVRIARQQLFHIAVISSLVIATTGCAAFRGFGATPEPTDFPPPPATPVPTTTPAPTTAAATPDAFIDHPTGATDVVLRLEMGGGLVPMGYFATQIPQFTLYGDGTVVFRPQPSADGATFGDPLPAFKIGRLSEDAVQQLLAFALGTGRLENAKQSYDNGMIADASTTLFTLNADGREKNVSVYALTETPAEGADAADRDGMSKLSTRLLDFASDPLSRELDGLRTYDPDSYRVTMYDANVGDPVSEPADWPWTDLKLADFPKKGDEPGRVKVLTRVQVAKLTSVPNGGQMSIWVKGSDGNLYDFAVRPNLPDEIATGVVVD